MRRSGFSILFSSSYFFGYSQLAFLLILYIVWSTQ